LLPATGASPSSLMVAVPLKPLHSEFTVDGFELFAPLFGLRSITTTKTPHSKLFASFGIRVEGEIERH